MSLLTFLLNPVWWSGLEWSNFLRFWIRVHGFKSLLLSMYSWNCESNHNTFEPWRGRLSIANYNCVWRVVNARTWLLFHSRSCTSTHPTSQATDIRSNTSDNDHYPGRPQLPQVPPERGPRHGFGCSLGRARQCCSIPDHRRTADPECQRGKTVRRRRASCKFDSYETQSELVNDSGHERDICLQRRHS